jgi:hypothetical protein
MTSHQRTARACALGLTLALSTLTGSVALATPPPPSSVARLGPAKATPAEVSTYAERERQAPAELAKFQGGDTLVIGGSALVLVLVIIVVVLVL